MSNVNFIAGIPGTGKTALLIDVLQREVIAEGRPVFIDMLDDRPNKADPAASGPSIPQLAIPHQVIADARKWHEDGVLPDGAALVIDEAQEVWGVAPSGAKLGPDLLAMNRIRHRGITLYFTSQRPAMMHAHVRGLVGRYVLLRDLGVLGRRYYEWPEFPERPLAFKEAPQQKRYHLPKHVFGLYRSSALHVKHKRTIPRAVIVAGVGVVVLAFLAFRIYSSFADKVKPASGGPAKAQAGEVASVRSAPPVAPARRALAVSAPVRDREPYAGIGLHMAGSWEQDGKTRVTFTASVDGRAVATVRDLDLQKAGYGWRILAPCSAVLIFGERERAVTCDAPQPAPVRGGNPAPPQDSASAPA